MTGLAGAARPEEEPGLRAVPWRRMAWVTWRQHWLALVGMAAFLGILAVYVWIAGVRLHHAYTAATTCNPASATCSALITNFNFMNHFLVGGYTLQLVPPLIGAFVGAPVLARELETGTFRYTWTQGFGRRRWTLAKLAMLGAAVTTAAGAISVLLTWYYGPYLATGHQARSLAERSVFASTLFDLRGVAFVAWTLTAFAIGGLAGILIRRAVPAIAAAMVGYTGLALVVGNLLRQHYLAPVLTRTLYVPGSAWVMSQWWTKNGRFAFTGVPSTSLIQQLCPNPRLGPLGKPSPGRIVQCLAGHGYTQWIRYQPASRFWPFQWIEGGWLLALSLVLIAATVWLVRRRVA
jgi:ABC-type transport system involved in multi-copper enzyme maturation permease subunit